MAGSAVSTFARVRPLPERGCASRSVRSREPLGGKKNGGRVCARPPFVRRNQFRFRRKNASPAIGRVTDFVLLIMFNTGDWPTTDHAAGFNEAVVCNS